ncbi:MAG: HDIG domain-containing protein [Phycisphaerales bacterium]|nr:MAG: HDIG domain-containing protein [Phycisphaerales bacterium]
MSAERGLRTGRFIDTDVIASAMIWLLFVVLSIPIVSFDLTQQGRYRAVVPTSVIVLLIAVAAGVYIWHYQKRIVKSRSRGFALAGLLVLMLAVTKIGVLSTGQEYWATSWATGAAVAAAIIMTTAYDQRFAIGMAALYCVLASFAVRSSQNNSYQLEGINLLVTMAAGGITCCFLLKEIRTRMKLLQVSVVAALVVFVTAASVGCLSLLGRGDTLGVGFVAAGHHALATFLVGLLIQSLLPVIEKVFRIATSMTLLDYSDANQPLLKRLAMEAPGTFSHSLLIGSIAEAAAASIGCNGLLCRVGAYYHDIGKLNKPRYFVENEMGSASRHKELSPAMSQLIIVGHVKDGIEMAKEYGLPSVLRQFIETHHGTTLVEPFYNEAKKQHEAPASKGSSARKPKEAPPRESEFRYAGPRPLTKEAGIVMLADAVEGAVRSLPEVTLAKVEVVVHNMAMRRLQDGQFDECDLSLRELSQIGASMSKTLAAHYHGRIAYPSAPDVPQIDVSQPKQADGKK